MNQSASKAEGVLGDAKMMKTSKLWPRVIKHAGGANQIVAVSLLHAVCFELVSRRKGTKKDTEASKVKATVLENFKFTLVAIKDTEDLEKFHGQFLN